ncbi:MAG: Nex18 symbiotically induced protein [Acidobacteria bacterium]|nr:Nex18 symbiotically induced protein [Acidobacteriota bacterium]
MSRVPVVVAAFVVSLVLVSSATAQPKDIVDTAVAAGSFKTLAKLLTDADLVTIMKSPGPFTVFAPTDEAFAKVPKETLDALAKDKAKLQAVLKYHVLTSKWTSDDLKLVKSTGTAEGRSVAFGATGGTITVNGAKVIKTNVDCTNGMIHVIDAVLIPK